MSPNRFQANVRLWIYRFLVLRDSERCARCFEIPTAKNGSTAKNTLDVDHVDGNPWNNEPDNLRLLCRKCNITLRNQHRSVDSAKNDIQRKEGCPSTRVIREAVDYSHPSAPIPMQANFLFEVDFRKWLLRTVQEKGFISKSDAIAAGAEVVGCSPQSTSSYLTKLISSAGPLTQVKDMLGNCMLKLKDHLQEKPPIKIDLDKFLDGNEYRPFSPQADHEEPEPDPSPSPPASERMF